MTYTQLLEQHRKGLLRFAPFCARHALRQRAKNLARTPSDIEPIYLSLCHQFNIPPRAK